MNDYEIQTICARFNFNEDKFREFIKDYYIVPLAEMPPHPDDRVELSFETICKRVGFPKNIVRRLQRAGAIGFPITSSDLDFLYALQKIYGKTWFVKTQLTKFSMIERERLIIRPELNRWEKWAYSRFLYNKIEYGTGGRMLNPEKRIRIIQTMEMIEEIFKAPACENMRLRLLQIRKMATNDRAIAQKHGLALDEMAKKRGIRKEDQIDN